MNNFNAIQRPTLLIDEEKTRRNIQDMCQKARQHKIRFRPHFKTHQSAEIGEWLRFEGVTAITVSSVEMAQYFAQSGWRDITIAFPVNWRQIDSLRHLARSVHLELLVESAETVAFLAENLKEPADIWIKVDSGAHRTGLPWNQPEQIGQLARQVSQTSGLHLRGLLTHAGQTYHAASRDEICRLYAESIRRMSQARTVLLELGLPAEISVGDTPGCKVCEDLGDIDEMRPGNFVFYDAQQVQLGSCTAGEVSVALACPVVARQLERQEIIIYGGAVHLSKDYCEVDGSKSYGLVALPEDRGWGSPLAGAYVKALSQEHGVIRLREHDLKRIQVGSLVCILPAHSCLTVTLMKDYQTLDGKKISTMNS